MPREAATGRRLRLTLCCIALLGVLQGVSWANVLEFGTLRKLAAARFDDAAVQRIVEWEGFVATAAPASLQAKLQTTNDFFNERLRWSSDEQIYGVDDYWATPLETLGMGEADCEDFSIAKYITLLALGVEPRSLRLVYVKAHRPGGASQAHMVLAWYASANAEPLILDNINGAVLPASRRQDLTPIFSFNADDLWISGATGPSNASPRLRLSRWRQVLDRIVDQGFRANW